MINQVESNITWAISEMEKDRATSIQGEIIMGNGDKYYYEIRKCRKDKLNEQGDKHEKK